MSQSHLHTSAKKRQNIMLQKYVFMPHDFSWPEVAIIFSLRFPCHRQDFAWQCKTLPVHATTSSCFLQQLEAMWDPRNLLGHLLGGHRGEEAIKLFSGYLFLGGSKRCQKSHESSMPKKNVGLLKRTWLWTEANTFLFNVPIVNGYALLSERLGNHVFTLARKNPNTEGQLSSSFCA